MFGRQQGALAAREALPWGQQFERKLEGLLGPRGRTLQVTGESLLCIVRDAGS